MTLKQLMTPAEIISELDKYIISQNSAKKAVAVALRNRFRRMQVSEPLRSEITPKNILMIGSTGVGKTEMARRLAKLTGAPFLKVEATQFTEVGYIGRNVESIVRDLIQIAMASERKKSLEHCRHQALDKAEERVLDILLPPSRTAADSRAEESAEATGSNNTRQKFRKKLREGDFDDKEIEIDIAEASQMEILGPPGMEELAEQLQGMFKGMKGVTKNKKLPVKDALNLMADEEAGKMVDEEMIRTEAIKNVEENGIVFIDEIDKIATHAAHGQGDVSRQGVQRDLLPLIEGTVISTRYGSISTDHILFIASGAFHVAKPDDLMPEFQGRFPVQVEFESLTKEDFLHILTKTDHNLVCQYQALLETEGCSLDFDEPGIQRIAEVAFLANELRENIGARRLYTVMERLLEEASFNSPKQLTITKTYVDQQLGDLVSEEDLTDYIL